MTHLLRRFVPALATLCAALLGTGCATYSQKASGNIDLVRSGQVDAALLQLEGEKSGRNRQLGLVESARLKLLAGRLDESRQEFTQAIDASMERAEGAVIKVREVGGTLLASTITDDTTRPYVLPGYEAVMALQQKGLNDLFLGDQESAAVEFRRAVFAQDLIAEQNAREIEKAEQEAQSKQAAAMGKVRESFATMAPALGRVKNSFQNAYAWYLAAAMYEAQADRPNAYIAYKKAHELAPDNPHLRRDLMRLAATESPDELAAFSTAFDLKPDCCPQPAAEVIVVVEEGWISRRQSVKLPIPVGYSIQSLTFPTYFDQPYTPMALDVQIDGAAAGQVAPLCFLQSLAYHDLREKMPGILLRNLTRGTARGVAQKQMMDSRNVWIKAASLALSAGTAVTDQGDTRSWTSLPMAVQLFRAPVEPGSRAIRLVNRQTGQAQDISVDVAAGELKLVWMADLAARSVVSVASLTGKGATAALAQHDGLGGSVGAPGVSTPADAPVVSADAPSALAGAAAPTPPIETADPIADTPAAVQPSAPPTGGLPAHAARIQAGAVPLESAPRGNGSGRPVQSGGRARVTVF